MALNRPLSNCAYSAALRARMTSACSANSCAEGTFIHASLNLPLCLQFIGFLHGCCIFIQYLRFGLIGFTAFAFLALRCLFGFSCCFWYCPCCFISTVVPIAVVMSVKKQLSIFSGGALNTSGGITLAALSPHAASLYSRETTMLPDAVCFTASTHSTSGAGLIAVRFFKKIRFHNRMF
jgi:hypothetical protein